MFKPTVLIAATLLCAPAFAQETQTIPVRAALSRIFLDMKAPFVIGPGIDGDITFSNVLLENATSDRIQTILSTLPYKVEYAQERGIHFIRRKSDTAVAATPTNPTTSVAAPKVTVNPTAVLNYRDALLWELTRLEMDRERATAAQVDVDMAFIRSTDSAIRLLKTRLSELDSKTPRATQAHSYSDSVRLELLRAEMEQARLMSQYGPSNPMLRESQSVIAFLKKRLAELESRTAQPARKTAKR